MAETVARACPVQTDELPWLTISEAAERSGRKIDAMRALVRRGRVPRRKGNNGAWLVQLPGTVSQTDRDSALDPITDNGLDTDLLLLREQLTKLRFALARTEGELTTVRSVAEANSAAAERLLSERNGTITELRAERDRLLELLGQAQSALAKRGGGSLARLWDWLFGSGRETADPSASKRVMKDDPINPAGVSISAD